MVFSSMPDFAWKVGIYDVHAVERSRLVYMRGARGAEIEAPNLSHLTTHTSSGAPLA